MATTNTLIYTKVQVEIAGSPAMEASKVSFDRTVNSVAVKTINKGYSGETPGAPMSEMTLDFAVPDGQFEFDIESAIQTVTPVEFTIKLNNGKFVNFNGTITNDSLSYSIDDNTTYNLKARGTMSFWEG